MPELFKHKSKAAWFIDTFARRRLALLGGTTTLADCLVAMRYLAGGQNLVKGPAIAEYEQAFARVIGVRHACSFASARVGFYGLLRIMGVGPGDEVLLQAPTHIVVPNAIRYVGARPVYADCSPDTWNMDLAQAEKKISAKTKVLVIQHTFGIPADMEKALELARRHGLVVIEDCVHALGARYDGKMVGSFGKAAFFSTEETKTISTTMGGMVVTDDPDLAAKIREFRDGVPWPSAWLTARYVLKLALYHFLTEPYLHRYTRAIYELIGRRHPLPRPTTSEELLGERPPLYEQRLSNAQAALGLRQLQRLEENLSHRRAIANLYGEQLSKLGLKLPKLPAQAEAAYVRFPVWVEDRGEAVNLSAPHVVMGTWFTSVLEEAVSPEHGEYPMGTCPQAEDAAIHLINLPTHPRVRVTDAMAIVSAVVRSLAKAPMDNRANSPTGKTMRSFNQNFANSYYLLKPFIPRRLQIGLRRVVAARKRALCRDIWPIDPAAAQKPEKWRGWPEGKRFALVMTHDVDTLRGHDKCDRLMRLEENLGFRSSFNFVAGEYRVSGELRRNLTEHGFEVGVHGLFHNRELYKSRQNFREHAVQINNYLKEWKSVGFRSPCMYHNLEWIHDLRIEYDSSTFDTDPFEPQPDGVGTIFPFQVKGTSDQKGYIELPYTLPQDFTLFILFRDQNIDIWKKKLAWIAEHGGMVLLNTHPDYMNFGGEQGYEEYPAAYYEEFLKHVKREYKDEYWSPLPHEMAEFWLSKDGLSALDAKDEVTGMPAVSWGLPDQEKDTDLENVPVTLCADSQSHI